MTDQEPTEPPEPTLKQFIENDTFADFANAPIWEPHTTADRLAAKKAEQDELALMRDMHDAGFESPDDFRAWKELEELRHLTIQLRGNADRKADDRLAPPRPRRVRDQFPLAG